MPEILVRSTPSGKGRYFYLIVVILKSPNIDRFPKDPRRGSQRCHSMKCRRLRRRPDDGAQVRSVMYGPKTKTMIWVQPSAGQMGPSADPSRYFEKKSYNYLICKNLTEGLIWLAKRTRSPA